MFKSRIMHIRLQVHAKCVFLLGSSFSVVIFKVAHHRFSTMELEYSILVDPSTYDSDGLCRGIPLRCHVAADLEEVGTFRAIEDYKKMVGPLDDYRGSLGPKFGLLSVWYPAIIPERLERLAYLKEIAFIADGSFVY